MKVGDYVLPRHDQCDPRLYQMFEGNRPRKIIRMDNYWVILKGFDDKRWTWMSSNYRVVPYKPMEENE